MIKTRKLPTNYDKVSRFIVPGANTYQIQVYLITFYSGHTHKQYEKIVTVQFTLAC